ncbi:hypothetical protein F5X68DRAFT_7708 [Plectosphaerella plurivora]|uniref:Uncharacterized protein n=1 Tax=Plectosphaerella plurivora TaxID=936078 RepID=A0A9P9AD73_9PEZI|nr:hypothetical protein F5X68DRAFT_7708 [Plectosphaerella plurivora]
MFSIGPLDCAGVGDLRNRAHNKGGWEDPSSRYHQPFPRHSKMDEGGRGVPHACKVKQDPHRNLSKTDVVTSTKTCSEDPWAVPKQVSMRGRSGRELLIRTSGHDEPLGSPPHLPSASGVLLQAGRTVPKLHAGAGIVYREAQASGQAWSPPCQAVHVGKPVVGEFSIQVGNDRPKAAPQGIRASGVWLMGNQGNPLSLGSGHRENGCKARLFGFTPS